MVGHTLKILQQLLQDFLSVSDHFGTLCIKGLKCINDTDFQILNSESHGTGNFIFLL